MTGLRRVKLDLKTPRGHSGLTPSGVLAVGHTRTEEEYIAKVRRIVELESLLKILIDYTVVGETKDFVYPRWVWERILVRGLGIIDDKGTKEDY